MSLILVVDGDADLTAALATVLSDAGHTVHVVANLVAAARHIQLARPDLVVLDVAGLLDEPAALEFARSLRRHAAGPRDLPVLLVTGFDTAGHPGLGEAASASGGLPLTDHLEKPFDFDDLRRKVARLLAAGATGPPARSGLAVR